VFIAAGPWEVFWLEGAVERAVTLQGATSSNADRDLSRFRNAGDDPEAMIAVVATRHRRVDWHRAS
jgi:hypothetical protein